MRHRFHAKLGKPNLFPVKVVSTSQVHFFVIKVPGEAMYTTSCCPVAAFATVGVCCAFIMGFWCRSISFEPDLSSPILDDRDDLPNLIFNELYFGPWSQGKTEITGVSGALGEGFTSKFLTVEKSHSTLATTKICKSHSKSKHRFCCHWKLFLSVYSRSKCVDLEFDPDLDSKWVATRAFTVITVVLGGILGLMVCSTPLTAPFMVEAWTPIAVCFILILTLFQGLTFLFLRSDACQDNPFINELSRLIWEQANLPDSVSFYQDECEMDSGMYASIAATVCWLCAGVGMLVLGPPTLEQTGKKSTTQSPPEQPVEEEPVEDAEE